MLDVNTYIDSIYSEAFSLIKELAAIPSPSHDETRRVAFLLDWAKKNGLEGAYSDEEKNVIIPYALDKSDKYDLFLAHTDVVFPDTTPFTVIEEEDKLAAPGIGDDTANVVALILFARYVIKNKVDTKRGVLFICNSCEEGRGDLKGSKAICETFRGRINTFTSFDCDLGKVVDSAVGSERYEVRVKTEGGHSYSAFGNKNAIVELARVIMELNNQLLPKEGKTTYNFGTIEGGTSVNTIAQDAMCTYEYRSDVQSSIRAMRKNFNKVIFRAEERGIDINSTSIGVRPCSDGTDSSALTSLASAELEKEGIKVRLMPSSTDCNIPLSQGIRATAFGLVKDVNPHTRDEYIVPSTLKAGYRAGLNYLIKVVLSDL